MLFPTAVVVLPYTKGLMRTIHTRTHERPRTHMWRVLYILPGARERAHAYGVFYILHTSDY